MSDRPAGVVHSCGEAGEGDGAPQGLHILWGGGGSGLQQGVGREGEGVIEVSLRRGGEDER